MEMQFRKELSILTVFFAIFLAGCSNLGSYGTSDNSGYGNDNTARAETAQEIQKVTIKNFVFDPAIVTISPGEKLIFVNEDAAPHTATANSGDFDTAQLNQGESGTIVINDAGTYEYFCTIHPAMKGTVVVK